MVYGKKAWVNAYKSPATVRTIIQKDNWKDKSVSEFIKFWSNILYLNIDGMYERIDKVYNEILSNSSPSIEQIVTSLKTKSPRWKKSEVKRIAHIIHQYCIRKKTKILLKENIHEQAQHDLGKIGPVYTIWCHYLIEPLAFPPIDKFNYTAYCFITSCGKDIVNQVPQSFSYLPINGKNDYTTFKLWFIKSLINYKGENFNILDVVSFDKALMSFGSLIQKIFVK